MCYGRNILIIGEVAGMTYTVSQEKLDALCVEWQSILHLQAWDIVVKICRSSEFEDKDCVGENLWDLRVCKSFIRICTLCLFSQKMMV